MVELLEPPKLKLEATPTDYQRRFGEGRDASGVTLKELAEGMTRAGVKISFVAISQFERGLSSLSLPVFLKACELLHLRTDWVLHGRGKMFEGGRPDSAKPRAASRVGRANGIQDRPQQ